ncbi:inner centromere protein-like [Ctenocephalides felis]|uniref:inner centromere protein-like n=1 Tax=Ctenocephalides felis TaxID=7515 RepID=UPI000E6E14F6|nr:inner centromere protein-like [Ctenocephalides felis]
MDGVSLEKFEQELLKKQKLYLSLIQPVIQELVDEHNEFMKNLEACEPPQTEDVSTVGRPRRNAAKSASNKISTQAHLKITKLRRPDDKDVTGNIYDLPDNKTSILESCSNITQDISVQILNNERPENSENPAISSDEDEEAMRAPAIKKRGRKKIRKIKAEKLSVAISIKEEVEEDAQTNEQTHVIENIVNETLTINDHQEINEDKELPKNDSGLSVYQDAVTTQVIAAESSPNELINLSPPLEDIKVQKHIKDDKKLSDKVEVVINRDPSLELPKENLPNNSAPIQSNEEPKEINANATFMITPNLDIPIVIKQELKTPERQFIPVMDQTIVMENLLTPATTVKPHPSRESPLITDDESISGTSPLETVAVNAPEPRSQVKSRVHALEKVIASEQKMPSARVTRTKTRMNKENLQLHSNMDALNAKPTKIQSAQKLTSTIKVASVSKIATLSAKKFISSKNTTPQIVKNTKLVLQSTQKSKSPAKDDSLKKQAREEEALKKKEQMLLEKQEERKRKRLEKERLAQQSREQQEREKQEKIAKEKERKQKLIQEREEKAKEEMRLKKLQAQQRAQEAEMRRKAEEAARLEKLKQIQEEQRKLEMQVKLAAEQARLKAQEAEKKQQLQTNAKSDATFVHPNPEESILDYSIAPVAMVDGFENLQSDYSTDEDEKPTKNNKQRPDWSKPEARQAAIINQARTSTKLVDLLFNVKATTPDLRVIFPGISKDKLNRRSSAVWKTPPRYSMLPRF